MLAFFGSTWICGCHRKRGVPLSQDGPVVSEQGPALDSEAFRTEPEECSAHQRNNGVQPKSSSIDMKLQVTGHSGFGPCPKNLSKDPQVQLTRGLLQEEAPFTQAWDYPSGSPDASTRVLQLRVAALNGTSHHLELPLEATVLDVKKELQLVTFMEVNAQQLLLDAQILQQWWTLEHVLERCEPPPAFGQTLDLSLVYSRQRAIGGSRGSLSRKLCGDDSD